jgi:hypothetical protein
MERPPKKLANLRTIAAELCGKAILRRFRILEVKWLSERERRLVAGRGFEPLTFGL